MRPDSAERSATWHEWQLSLFPAFVLLGLALPISFAAWVDRYLFYLRPEELLPTYATAWLLLAVLSAPLSILAGAVLLGRQSTSKWARRLRSFMRFIVVFLAATAIAGALASGFMLWLRSFGISKEIDPREALTIVTFAAGLLTACTPAGRRLLWHQYSLAKWATILGGFSLVSLPFMGWRTVSAPNTRIGGDTRPHILLVTVDTLSAEHMSLYGAARPTTPNLDQFARAATVFDRSYANANFTTAGIASLVTGTRPWTHRAVQLPGWPIEATRENSLPAVLNAAGYQMGYVSTNAWAGATRLGLGSYFAFGRDAASALTVCHDAVAAILRYDCAASELLPFRFVQMAADRIQEMFFDSPPNWQLDPRTAISPALAWLRTVDKDRPIFLWLHLMPPHSPYAAPAPWLGEFDASPEARRASDSAAPAAYLFRQVAAPRVRVLEARYDEAIRYCDYFLGQYLKDALAVLGDNTVVVVTADHGESFEHGYGMHTGPGLYEPIIRIPLLIKLPRQSVGVRTGEIAEQVDVAPTLAALVGVSAPVSWEGRSLLGPVAGSADAAEVAKPVFAMNFEQNRKHGQLTTGSIAVIDQRWKLVHYMGSLHYQMMPALQDELYDLLTDPTESQNLATKRPEEAAALMTLINRALTQRRDELP